MNNQDSRDGHTPSEGLGHRGIERLAWLPIPLLLAIIIVARVTGMSEIYEAPTLRLVLSFIFYTLVSLSTLILIGRSFLVSGTFGLLLLECGLVLWSLAGTVGDAVFHGDANINITIFNTGILLSGMCLLAGAILSIRPQRALHNRPVWLATGCVIALGVMWLVTWATLTHRLPVFFVQGQGGTPVRFWVLISAILMFMLSAGLILASQRLARSLFTFWFALALLLLAIGLFGIMIQSSLGSVVNWLSRTAQWLGGFYLLLAAFAALRVSGLALLLPKEQPNSMLYHYAVTVVMVIAAAAMRFVFLPVLGIQAPFVTFYPAVMLAALYGGFRSGILATILSALLTDYFWMEPLHNFTISQLDDRFAMVIFLISCMMISIVTEAMRRARDRASIAETQALLDAERATAAEALLKSESMLRAVLDQMPSGVTIRDALTGGLILYNTKSLEIMGRLVDMPEHFIQYQAFHPDGRPYRAEEWPLSRSISTGEIVYEEDIKCQRDDGTNITLSFSTAPVRDSLGRIISGVGIFHDITERKRAEEALKESEKKYRELVKYAPVGIYEIDFLNRKFVTVNESMILLTGYTREELLAMDPLDILADESKDAFIARLSKMLKGEKPDEAIEYKVIAKDGHAIDAVLNMSFKFDEQGKPTGAMVIGHDITERKRIEEALRDSEEKFRMLAESSTFAIIMHQGDRWIYANPAAGAISGYTKDDLDSMNFWDVVHPDYKEMVKQRGLDRQQGKAVPETYEFKIIAKDGKEKWVNLTGTTIQYKNKPTVLISIIDITERKQADAVLQSLLQRFATLVSNIHSGILFVGEGGIELTNQAFCDYFGLQEIPADLIGFTPDKMMEKIKNAYLHPEEETARIQEIIAEGEPVIGEEIAMQGGRTCLRDYVPIHLDGKLFARLWQHTDITNRKQAETALEEVNKELESFSYSVSHDLRAPLRAIDGFSRKLEREYGDKLDKKAGRLIDIIRNNTEKMGFLINDLLSFSRVQKINMNTSEIDMEKLSNEVWDEIRAAHEQRELKFKITKMLPGFGDRNLIRQVLFNLISNAVKFTVNQKPGIIELGSYKDSDQVVYRLKDNGTGFDMAYSNKLFGVFQRLHGEEYQGTGIGLAIVQRIINKHGGRVWAEAEVDKGATFYFTLPSTQQNNVAS